ncbi:prostaglandin E2 receptor EP2 subtype-like [Crassostrea virginica]
MRNQTVYRILCEEKENENVIPIYIQLALGAFGNLFAVILLLASRHKHRWQSIYILFTGLVMIDLIHNCVCYPLVLKRYISNFTWCFSIPMCDFFSFMETCSHLASGMIIGLMTVDRYLYITSFRNQKCPRRRTYVAALFTVLMFASIIAGLQLIGLGNSQLYYPGSWCFLDFTDKTVGNRVNAAIYSVIGLCSMFVTVIIGVKTIYIIRRNPEYQALLLDNNLVTGVYDEHVTTFLVISMIDILLHTCNLSTTNGRKELWLIRLMYLNTQINPWIYVIMRKESVRRCFVMVSLCWRRLCNRENHQTQENDQDSGFFQ